MTAWWLHEKFPKSVASTYLIGESLVLDPETPPEDTTFSGMKAVIVRKVNPKEDPKNWDKYKVLMTERDISTAIEAMLHKKTFTFDREKGDKYAHSEIEA